MDVCRSSLECRFTEFAPHIVHIEISKNTYLETKEVVPRHGIKMRLVADHPREYTKIAHARQCIGYYCPSDIVVHTCRMSNI